MNYDELSISEGLRILRALHSLGIPVDLVVYNKLGMSEVPEESMRALAGEMRHIRTVKVPFFKDMATPREKMEEIAQVFSEFLL